MSYLHILIIKLGAMGDVVRTSYAVNALATALGPGLRVTWVTEPGCFDLLRFNPYVHAIIDADQLKRRSMGTIEKVFSLDDELASAGLALELKAKKLIGAYLENGSVTYTEDSSSWFDMGLISRLGKVRADRLKRENVRSHANIFEQMFGIPAVMPRFFGSATLERDWTLRRDGIEKVVGFNLFAGKRWPSKEMPKSEAIRLLQAVSAYLAKRYLRFRLALFCDESTRPKIKDYLIGPEVEVWDCSPSVLEFAAAIRACDYVFSTDSLGLHLAISQRVPNLSFFAPTSAQEIDTFGTGIKVVSEGTDYCSYQPTGITPR